MNDPRRSEHTRSAQEWTEETQRIRQPYPPYVDPAYSGQSPYPPPYYPGSSPNANANHPTDKLPQYWLHGQPPPDHPPEQPTPGQPKAPRWLWIAAAAAVLLVAALVIALVIANGTARKQTCRARAAGDAEFIESAVVRAGVALAVRRHVRADQHRIQSARPMRARCRPSSTTSPAKAARSASPTWTTTG